MELIIGLIVMIAFTILGYLNYKEGSSLGLAACILFNLLSFIIALAILT